MEECKMEGSANVNSLYGRVVDKWMGRWVIVGQRCGEWIMKE
jgi:hypothetical protein